MERSQSGANPEARVQLLRGDHQEDPAIAELRASEARLRAAEQMAQLGHWDRDYVARGIRISEEAYRILGVPVGQRSDDLAECERMFTEAVHPDDRERVLQAARDALAGGPPYNVEYRVVRLDGEMRVLASRGTVTRDENGRPLRFIGYFQDITELKRLEAQFLQAQKMEAVGQLAGGVAHDFNNLLTVINGCTELLLGSAQEPSNLELLGEIRSCGARAAGLTRQLLAFSHKQVLQPVALDVNASLQGLLNLLRRLLGAHIEIDLALAPTAVCAKVDPGQLEQALINLAINARDAMPDGGQLVIQTADAEPFVVITVRDTGCGMPQATCARIFEPFFTTKGPSGGTGLGLAMVHGFVVQSGGRVEVESTPGAGTTFRICLPHAKARKDDEPTAAPPVTRATAPGTETVLVAEDDESLRFLTRRILRRAGYTVLEARTGDEALAIARRHGEPIHLLLTDLVMPGTGGWRLAEQLTKEQPATRVLYMSAYPDENFLTSSVHGGTLPYLQKPFRPAELLQRVRDLLDTSVARPT